MSEPTALRASFSRIYTVDVNTTDPVLLARRLHQAAPATDQRPCLLIDCQRLRCLHTRGVSFLVSKLLLTRAAGADVLLYNVGPVLERVLHLLHLDEVFQVWPASPGMPVRHGVA